MTTLYVNRYSARCGYCHATVPDWQTAKACDATVGIYQNEQTPCFNRFTHCATESNLARSQREMIIHTRSDLIWMGGQYREKEND